MQVKLSNYGERLINKVIREKKVDLLSQEEKLRYLLDLKLNTAFPHDPENSVQEQVRKLGWIETCPDDESHDDIELGYDRNPLEHVERVTFEFTTVCNLNCLHCRNGQLTPVTEKNIPALKHAVDVFEPLGITRFDFIGGEVTLYGRGWLDLVSYIREKGNCDSAVITSGWFFGETNFKAAGKSYANDEEYLADLAAHGLSYMIISLDGPEEIHDHIRQSPGLYRRIIEGVPRARAHGIQVRWSVVYGEFQEGVKVYEWLEELVDLIYDFPEDFLRKQKIFQFRKDDFNYNSNFIDVGNGVQMKSGHTKIDDYKPEYLRCKAFYRPHPNLRIKANGGLSICPLIDAGEGYGNVHAEDLVYLLNNLQNAFVFKLHAEDKVADYLPYLDREIFGEHFDHICSLRTAVTMLAREMHDYGIDPRDVDSLREANLRVARRAGFQPAIGKTATGNNLPY